MRARLEPVTDTLVRGVANAVETSVQQIRDAVRNVKSGVSGNYEFIEFDFVGSDKHNIEPGHYRLKVDGDAAKWLYRNGYMLGNADIDVGVAAKLLLQWNPKPQTED